jgi:hypothetical protein
MERHQRLDKLPQPEAIGMPRRCDGVGHALRQTFAPLADDAGMFRGLLDKLDQDSLSRRRGD